MATVAHSQPWWAMARVTGIVAIVAIMAVVGLGLRLAHGTARGTGNKARSHRRLTWFALATLVAHVAAALLDRHHVPPYAVLAPFSSPVRRFAAGTGAVALWGAVFVAMTAASRRWCRRSWRRLHYIAYPTAAAGTLHSLLGSDRMATIVAIAGATVATMVVLMRSVVVGHRRPAAVEASETSDARVLSEREVSPIWAFAVTEAPGFVAWAGRHHAKGALLAGTLCGGAALVFALPLGFAGLLWLSICVGILVGAASAASVRHWVRQQPAGGGPLPSGPLWELVGECDKARDRPARSRRGWPAPQPAHREMVRCRSCEAPQSVWAARCSQCGADLARCEPIWAEGSKPTWGSRLGGFATYHPQHLLTQGPPARGTHRAAAPLGQSLAARRRTATKDSSDAETLENLDEGGLVARS